VSDSSAALVGRIAGAIEAEFAARPPTICLIGLSGVGKSSTVNAMFGTRRTVSATVRGTTRFDASEHMVPSARLADVALECRLKVYDAVGLGEDVDSDANYLKRYREHLPKCDVALWIVAARNRAIALDQRYLTELAGVLPNLVIGLNQVDLVDPLDWSEAMNLPSPAQQAALVEIVADRRMRLARFAPNPDVTVVPYSAARYYNLQALFLACVTAAPPERRWMFDLVKSFSTSDWLVRAKGLSEAQRRALLARETADTRRIDPRDLALKLDRRRR
jgi:hypothetical protein